MSSKIGLINSFSQPINTKQYMSHSTEPQTLYSNSHVQISNQRTKCIVFKWNSLNTGWGYWACKCRKKISLLSYESTRIVKGHKKAHAFKPFKIIEWRNKIIDTQHSTQSCSTMVSKWKTFYELYEFTINEKSKKKYCF